MKKLRPYLQLMRFDRPIGFFLTGWSTLWAVWLAAHKHPSFFIVLIFVLGIIVMRAAGCVINDIADRKFDPHVERTKQRPLAAGTINLQQAIMVFIVLLILALLLVLQLNTYCLWIAIFTALLTIVYPFCKRFTYLPQLVLGIVFNVGILMAFAAQQNQLSALAWIIYISTIFWTVAYDTMYAMHDKEDDLKIGLKSTALLFGRHAQWIIAIFQVCFLLGLLLAGLLIEANIYYWLTLLIALALSVYQQYLIASGKPFKGFLNNNWLGLIIFIGILFN
jgi:4-hydroxybenzoate polyprenyltransferase